MELRGVYRIKSLPGIPDGVWVTDGVVSFEMPQPLYVEKGLQPSIEQLEWDPKQFSDLRPRPRHEN